MVALGQGLDHQPAICPLFPGHQCLLVTLQQPSTQILSEKRNIHTQFKSQGETNSLKSM